MSRRLCLTSARALESERGKVLPTLGDQGRGALWEEPGLVSSKGPCSSEGQGLSPTLFSPQQECVSGCVPACFLARQEGG